MTFVEEPTDDEQLARLLLEDAERDRAEVAAWAASLPDEELGGEG